MSLNINSTDMDGAKEKDITPNYEEMSLENF